jgi:hypothetical protein
MFVIVPEAMEKAPPVQEEPMPLLALVDYPKTSRRLHWLGVYYTSWGVRPHPFLDQRSPLFFPAWLRGAFIHFTNMYYARWMKQYDGRDPEWHHWAGHITNLCANCAKVNTCNELCPHAVAMQKPGMDFSLKGRIQSYCLLLKAQQPDQRGGRAIVMLPVVMLYAGMERPCLNIQRSLPPLAPIPEDQEEDEDEWE